MLVEAMKDAGFGEVGGGEILLNDPLFDGGRIVWGVVLAR